MLQSSLRSHRSQSGHRGRRERHRAAVAGLVCALGFALASCGPKAPQHNGYKANQKSPWKKAQPISLDEGGEVEVDGRLGWEKRRRARWYVVDIPTFGELELKLRSRQIGAKSGSEEFDVAFELMNEKTGKVLVRADTEEDDAGEEERSRKVSELDPGAYWIHIYLQDRRHAASFTLRMKFTGMAVEEESNFPAEVAYTPSLPAVPPIDDAPPPTSKPKCKKPPCKRPPKTPDDPQPTSIGARITGITATAGGTSIRIGAGTNRGVTQGARGRVVTSSGAGIPQGGFTIHRVSATESWASVKASTDAVNAAKRVRITPK